MRPRRKSGNLELARQKVKARRIEWGLSQAALAKRIGSLQPAIARMESRQISRVSMDFLLRIALILDLPVTIAQKAT